MDKAKDVPLRVAYEYGSLRDFFAGLSLLRVLPEAKSERADDIVARHAYNLADAMLVERRRRMQE